MKKFTKCVTHIYHTMKRKQAGTLTNSKMGHAETEGNF